MGRTRGRGMRVPLFGGRGYGTKDGVAPGNRSFPGATLVHFLTACGYSLRSGVLDPRHCAQHNDGRRGLGRVSLDRLKAGNRLALLHLQQAVEAFTTSSGRPSASLATMCSQARFFCSPTRRSSADSAGNKTRCSLRNSRARASSGAVCSRRYDSSTMRRSKASASSGLKVEVFTDASLMLRNRVLPERVVGDFCRVGVQRCRWLPGRGPGRLRPWPRREHPPPGSRRAQAPGERGRGRPVGPVRICVNQYTYLSH